jgi:uncharacterized protein GlcG (DUF336 family)
LAALALTAGAQAQDMRPVLSDASAQAVISGCVALAEEEGWNLAIAVYDTGADLKAFRRMDDTQLGSTGIAMWKGEAVANFPFPTGAMAEAVESTPALASAPGIAPLRGGVPLRTQDGAWIGGVGVSGATGEQDEQCAIAGAAAAGLVTGLEGAE